MGLVIDLVIKYLFLFPKKIMSKLGFSILMIENLKVLELLYNFLITLTLIKIKCNCFIFIK